MGIHWSTPVWLWPLLLFSAAGAVFLVIRAYDRTNPRPREGLRRTLTVLRSAVFVLLFLAIAGPVLSLLRLDHLPAKLVVVVEDSASMAIGDGNQSMGSGEEISRSRWEAALDLGGAVDSVFSSLDDAVEVVFVRGNGIEPLQEFRLADPVIPGPTNHGTNLVQLIRKARERFVGGSVRAMILVSDGQETMGQNPGSTLPAGVEDEPGMTLPFGPGGSVVQVVGVGDSRGTADRIIKDLRYPDTAYEGDEVVVDFAVDHRFAEGAVGSQLQVLLRGEEGVVADTTIPVTGKVVPVSLGFRPSGHGLQVYRLEVSPLDNERFLDNNQASLAMDIRKERSRLLLLSGTPGWDVRFLAQAAASEERISLEVVYRSVDGLVFADSLVPWSAPVDAEGWRIWEGVVLSDWSGSLTAQNWESLQDAVHEGLGLLVLPGDGPAGAPGPPAPPSALASLLPVRSNEWRWAFGPLFVDAALSQGGHPILEGLKGVGESSAGGGLSGLPPLKRVVMADPKVGSEILLTARHRGQPAGQGLTPLLVTDLPQDGRVTWVGGRNLWELAFWDRAPGNSGATPAGDIGSDPTGRRLLRNLLVWTAAGEENSGLVFTGRQAFFQEGERIRLAAQWRDMRGRPVLDRKLSLQLRQADAVTDTGQVRTFSLSPPDRNSGFADVVLPPLPPGRYTIQLIGQGDPPVTGRLENLVVAGHSIEATQVRMDRRRLVQMAGRHGGVFYQAGKTGMEEELWSNLLELDWSGEKAARRNRFDFWSGWPFLTLVAALLGIEWFLRRRNGLL